MVRRTSVPNFDSKFTKVALRSRLSMHLAQLVGARDPYLASGRHCFVQHYIRSLFAGWGRVEEHLFEANGKSHTNWILKLPSQRASLHKAPIIIGAHYDAVPGTPGADDNASGVAVLLELAHFFSVHAPTSPLWFVAFDLEEYGLLGSDAYAKTLQSAQHPVRLMLSLEMLGYCDPTPGSQQYPVPFLKRFYPDTGDFIALIGNLATIPVMWRLQRRVKQAGAACEWLPVFNSGRMIPAVRRSDHASFWDCGYPAILVTDTSFLRNPHYHRASDRIETLDLDFMTHICQGLIIGLQALT